jgi:HupE / UreJ protein
MRPTAARLLLLLLLTVSPFASAHVASTAFLTLQADGEHLQGSIELALRDVELAVGVDANNDGQITWGELQAAEPAMRDYLAAHLRLQSGNAVCALHFGALKINKRVDGPYAWLQLTANCSAGVRALTINYQLLQDIDPSHRGLLNLASGATVQTGVLGGSSPTATFVLGAPSRWRTFVDYLQAGIWHIWSGIDHLLFLLSLLLPAVLLRRDHQWEPVKQIGPAALSTLKVVTAFTLAHSLTLSLAALNVVHLPSRLTESVIAASIIVAALNNIFPIVTDRRARIAFAFGLLHGFGFASVLSEMGLPGGARLLSLLAFNLGIEAGQLAVVLAVMPVIFLLRTASIYRRTLMPWGSALIVLVASVWLVQRALAI